MMRNDRAFLIYLVVFTILPMNGAQAEWSLTGKPEILNGDTLKVSGKVVRLVGIVAPEQGQVCLLASGKKYDCGIIARTALMDLTAGVSVTCSIKAGVEPGLPFALCTAGGYDLSKGMTHAGWALAWPRTGTVYEVREKYARVKRHGLWKGRFTAPWEWQRGKRVYDMGAGAAK